MIELKVHVPPERETEFYRWFADWRDGLVKEDPAPVATSTKSQLDCAVLWWKSLTAKEVAIWSLWIDAAPAMVSADEIVEALGLGGPREIPGALAWSGRKGKRVGFRVTWRFRIDPASGKPVYGIEDVEYAASLRAARDASRPRTSSVHDKS